MKLFVKHISNLLAITAAILLIVIIISTVLINSNTGKKIITKFITNNVSEAIGYEVKINQLDIFLPIIFTAGKVTLADENGDFAYLNNLTINL